MKQSILNQKQNNPSDHNFSFFSVHWRTSSPDFNVKTDGIFCCSDVSYSSFYGLSFSLSRFYLIPSLDISHSLTVLFSCLCLSLSLCIFLCISQSLSICLSLSLCLTLCLSLCLSYYLSISLSLSVSLCITLSLLLSHCLSLYHSVSQAGG